MANGNDNKDWINRAGKPKGALNRTTKQELEKAEFYFKKHNLHPIDEAIQLNKLLQQDAWNSKDMPMMNKVVNNWIKLAEFTDSKKRDSTQQIDISVMQKNVPIIELSGEESEDPNLIEGDHFSRYEHLKRLNEWTDKELEDLVFTEHGENSSDT